MQFRSHEKDTAEVSDKAPAFQFYPKDWLSDGNVRAMGHEARGIYIDLLSIYWNDGGLPSDLKALASRVAVPIKTFQRLWPMIAPCFQVDGNFIRSKRLDREKVKQSAYRELQRSKGMKSAKSRVSNATAQPRLESGSSSVDVRLEPKPNSPSASAFTTQDSTVVVSATTDADAARDELRAALSDLRKRLPNWDAISDQAILDRPQFHSTGGGICRIDTCTNPGLLRATAAKVRAYGKPKASSRGAPAWDLGSTNYTEAEMLSWDDRLGPKPQPQTN